MATSINLDLILLRNKNKVWKEIIKAIEHFTASNKFSKTNLLLLVKYLKAPSKEENRLAEKLRKN